MIQYRYFHELPTGILGNAKINELSPVKSPIHFEHFKLILKICIIININFKIVISYYYFPTTFLLLPIEMCLCIFTQKKKYLDCQEN